MGDLIPFGGDSWRDVVDAQLDELNAKAAVLQEGGRVPEGLPPIGSWIRPYRVDDDGAWIAAAPWHSFAGWRPAWGPAVRCRQARPGEALIAALKNHIGDEADRYWYAGRRRDRWRLRVVDDRPDDGACRQCIVSLERDAEKADAARQAALRETFLAALPGIVQIDDDARRGRALREAFHQIGGGPLV